MKHLIRMTFISMLLMAAQNTKAADDKHSGGLTLGAIQRSIKAGMTTSEVVEAVGSPNLVTRGRSGRESWVYDRFATETSEQGFHVGGGGMGGGDSVLGALGLNGGRKKKVTSQRNLMLVVTFGADGMVDTFTYRSSKF